MPAEAKGWGKIAIGTRLEKMVDAVFLERWSNLISKGVRAGDGYIIEKDKVAHQAANGLVRRFLKTPADTLFMLDSDADIDWNFLNEFRDYEEGWKYDLFQAFYTRRGWPPEAIWYKRLPTGELQQCLVFDDDFTQDVAGIGTHCCLIRREVFEKLLGDNDPETFEWFFYPRNVKESEDMAFSKEAIEAGFSAGATTHLKAGHITRVTTGWDTYQEFLELSGNRQRAVDYRKLVAQIAAFTNESEVKVEHKIIRGSENVRKAWEKQTPLPTSPLSTKGERSPKEVRSFYGNENNGYLYDLAAWNFSPGYMAMTEGFKNSIGKRVLIVGCGIGGEAVQLVQGNAVDIFELPGVLKRFSEKRLDGKARFLEGSTLLDARLEKYDLIVMVDVLEHIHPDEFKGVMDLLSGRLLPEGEFFIHANFGEQDKYPMHFDNHLEFEAWEKRWGLKQEGDYTWRR